MLNQTNHDGLFTFPYYAHDWIILVLAFCGYCYRMYLWQTTPDVKNPTLKDYIGMLFLVAIITIGLYETAIYKKWPMRLFFFPFAVSIILAKDITDWLFMSREGRKFVITAIKQILTGLLKNFGYIKKENE